MFEITLLSPSVDVVGLLVFPFDPLWFLLQSYSMYHSLSGFIYSLILNLPLCQTNLLEPWLIPHISLTQTIWLPLKITKISTRTNLSWRTLKKLLWKSSLSTHHQPLTPPSRAPIIKKSFLSSKPHPVSPSQQAQEETINQVTITHLEIAHLLAHSQVSLCTQKTSSKKGYKTAKGVFRAKSYQTR